MSWVLGRGCGFMWFLVVLGIGGGGWVVYGGRSVGGEEGEGGGGR